MKTTVRWYKRDDFPKNDIECKIQSNQGTHWFNLIIGDFELTRFTYNDHESTETAQYIFDALKVLLTEIKKMD